MEIINLSNQFWTTKNLNTITFLNGENIPIAKNPEEFQEFTANKKSCFAYFNFDEKNIDLGICYNWFALNDKRGIIPPGYKLPSKVDAKILLDSYIGSFRNDSEVRMDKALQEKLRELNQNFSNSLKDQNSWNNIYVERNLNNDINFNAMALGSISPASKYNFGWVGVAFSIWLNDKDNKFRWTLGIQENKVSINGIPFKDGDIGCFVRLIKCDNSISDKETKIGTVTWMTENLNVDEFRNGDKILEVLNDQDWQNAINNKVPAFRYIKDNPKMQLEFGKIYNLFAVQDERGISPSGWRLPNIEDVTSTLDSLKIDGFDYSKHFTTEKNIQHVLNDKLLSTDSGGTNSSNLNLSHYPQLTGFNGFTSKSEIGKMWLNDSEWENCHYYNYTKSSFLPQRFSKENREFLNGYIIRCVKE
jgi:uncharacterized protein (TIGR02145 family)